MKALKKLSFIIIIPILLSGCYDRRAMEELGIIVGIGYDVESSGMDYKYKDTVETFIFKGEKRIEHDTVSGKAKSIYSTNRDIQTKFDKRWILGTEIVYLIGEGRATYGIKDIIDAIIRDPTRRLVAGMAVSKQLASDVYNMPPKSSSTVAETIRGMLANASQENFFSPRIEIPEILRMYYQEGRNIVIPYIEEVEDRLQITGLALFKDDKMVRKVALYEARLINLLRTSGGYGYESVNSTERNEYYEAYFKNKVKVKVSKEDEKLKYDIIVNLTGKLRVDSIDEKLLTAKEVKQIEKSFSEKIQKDLQEEVKKMQNQYKTDWLDLGKYAVAKYGRQGNYGSDETFCKAAVDVQVNVKISTIGQKKK